VYRVFLHLAMDQEYLTNITGQSLRDTSTTNLHINMTIFRTQHF